MKQLSKVLMVSTKKQVRHAFYRWENNYPDPDAMADGYCAMGLLICNAFQDTPDKRITYQSHETPEKWETFLMEQYGFTKDEALKFYPPLPENSIEAAKMPCPICKILAANKEKSHVIMRTSYIDMIIHLNDDHEATFKEIGEWLQSEGY